MAAYLRIDDAEKQRIFSDESQVTLDVACDAMTKSKALLKVQLAQYEGTIVQAWQALCQDLRSCWIQNWHEVAVVQRNRAEILEKLVHHKPMDDIVKTRAALLEGQKQIGEAMKVFQTVFQTKKKNGICQFSKDALFFAQLGF